MCVVFSIIVILVCISLSQWGCFGFENVGSLARLLEVARHLSKGKKRVTPCPLSQSSSLWSREPLHHDCFRSSSLWISPWHWREHNEEPARRTHGHQATQRPSRTQLSSLDLECPRWSPSEPEQPRMLAKKKRTAAFGAPGEVGACYLLLGPAAFRQVRAICWTFHAPSPLPEQKISLQCDSSEKANITEAILWLPHTQLMHTQPGKLLDMQSRNPVLLIVCSTLQSPVSSFRFWDTSGSVQDLFLALCTGIIPVCSRDAGGSNPGQPDIRQTPYWLYYHSICKPHLSMWQLTTPCRESSMGTSAMVNARRSGLRAPKLTHLCHHSLVTTFCPPIHIRNWEAGLGAICKNPAWGHDTEKHHSPAFLLSARVKKWNHFRWESHSCSGLGHGDPVRCRDYLSSDDMKSWIDNSNNKSLSGYSKGNVKQSVPAPAEAQGLPAKRLLSRLRGSPHLDWGRWLLV